MNNTVRRELPTLAATQRLAESLATACETPLTIALIGTLGAGKTQLVRFLCAALGSEAEVTSPTYVLMQSYRGRAKIYHLDFYRLDAAAQVWDLGVDELYEQACLVVIEWADKFPQCLPPDHLTIRLTQSTGELRVAEVTASGPRSQQVLQQLGG
ncbi:MAG: tRNA (adenosine(37)-N6)-threonylcarbamoyltransferase complex ATPase subunit type 1 TsaE [Planctomycetales bacterium]|nr:tRNA (adenosine(37)-N6)-threonylcarbamoyltransferase complex ATPase subunit type 1 TsaE [Planctomycetales bacterium]